eukprot:CAMPEP_0179145586 /NCGR_PEP_ID=MMETSP0796-20121207/70252_1 /TAXON_ID=73915 /ORGANISM="Pyrodinium bahamense, Strain pbaha01" /LENGTH=73 /DNA_ID=CAMNT_0020845993 /DNA_START=20 /DNA_END=237 /DNA_ORIENTATION=+
MCLTRRPAQTLHVCLQLWAFAAPKAPSPGRRGWPGEHGGDARRVGARGLTLCCCTGENTPGRGTGVGRQRWGG